MKDLDEILRNDANLLSGELANRAKSRGLIKSAPYVVG